MRVIFDLDGTLALVDHRRHLVEGDRKDWPAFFEACDRDVPNAPVLATLWALSRDGHEIWIVSGRSSQVQGKTLAWLQHHRVPYDTLVMRDEGDHTPDHELKARWAQEYNLGPANVLIVFDDRSSVVEMWRSLGFTCCQVAPGDF